MRREPLFICDQEYCGDECSYPVDMLRSYEDKIYCHGCWEDQHMFEVPVGPPEDEEYLKWHDLPKFVPEHEQQLSDIREAAQIMVDRHSLSTQEWQDSDCICLSCIEMNKLGIHANPGQQDTPQD